MILAEKTALLIYYFYRWLCWHPNIFWCLESLLLLAYISCHRYLGSPTFFLSPVLPTISFSKEYDNQRQRDLLRDLGPIYRWQCSKPYLLRLSPPLLLSPIFFPFWTYLSSHQHDYAAHCLHIIMLMLEYQHE